MSNQIVEWESRNAASADSVDTEELARRFRNGEMQAFDELVAAFQKRIFNLAFRMLNNYDDATEATQDVFVKVYKSIRKFREKSKFSTWLYAIASNVCRNRLRRTRRISQFEVVSLDQTMADGERTLRSRTVAPGPDPVEVVKRNEVKKLVEDIIAALPHEFGTVMIMRDIQGMSYEEIALALNSSLGTVKSRISRARAIVKKKLERAGVQP